MLGTYVHLDLTVAGYILDFCDVLPMFYIVLLLYDHVLLLWKILVSTDIPVFVDFVLGWGSSEVLQIALN